jgi:hypothetical protein
VMIFTALRSFGGRTTGSFFFATTLALFFFMNFLH